MSRFKNLLLTDIHVPDRLRRVDDNQALVLMASIEQHGLINPISVRSTPNGKAPYTLVAGAHRLRAHEVMPRDKIAAMVIKADGLEGSLLEIAENLISNPLTVLDRAKFVLAYREKWEEKHGEIDPKGGRPINRSNLPQLIEDELKTGFSEFAADRLGVSPDAIKRSTRIAKAIPQTLYDCIYNHPLADHQSALLRLSALPPVKLAMAWKAWDACKGDVDLFFAALIGTKKDNQSKAVKATGQVINRIGALAKKDRLQVMRDLIKHFRKEFETALNDVANDAAGEVGDD